MPERKPLREHSVSELHRLATRHSIQLPRGARKQQIIDELQQHPETADQEPAQESAQEPAQEPAGGTTTEAVAETTAEAEVITPEQPEPEQAESEPGPPAEPAAGEPGGPPVLTTTPPAAPPTEAAPTMPTPTQPEQPPPTTDDGIRISRVVPTHYLVNHGQVVSAVARDGTRTHSVARLQRALRDVGLYDGPLDGVSNKKLRAAITRGNKHLGSDQEGAPTPRLLATLGFTLVGR